MKINQKKLEEVFAILPNVNIFLSNKERSIGLASSFSDVGGRDDDVFQNIKAIYMAKGDCNADITIERFYSLGTRTVIQLQIGGEQKPIADIINEALDTAVLCEMAKIFSDYFRLVNYFTNLKHIVYHLVDKPDDILDKIDKYIDFAHWANEVESQKRLVYNQYKLFSVGEFIPPESHYIVDALDLYNILNTDEGIVPQETVYPINMRYINGKFSAELAACISNACYKITSFTCEERNISNIDIDNNDFVDEYLDKVFTEEAAEFVSNILMEYFMISIFAERTADGDILIKFVDGEDIICLARITPTKETIIW